MYLYIMILLSITARWFVLNDFDFTVQQILIRKNRRFKKDTVVSIKLYEKTKTPNTLKRRFDRVEKTA